MLRDVGVGHDAMVSPSFKINKSKLTLFIFLIHIHGLFVHNLSVFAIFNVTICSATFILADANKY